MFAMRFRALNLKCLLYITCVLIKISKESACCSRRSYSRKSYSQQSETDPSFTENEDTEAMKKAAELDDNRRIIGGNATDIQRLPWQVSISVSKKLICGGSILTKHIILTAAHCIGRPSKISKFKIRAGSSFYNKGGQLVSADRYYIHPKYCLRSKEFDVALLETKKPLEFSDTVSKITLVLNGGILRAREKVIVSGWGATEEGKNELPLFLQSAVIETISMKVCLKSDIGYGVDPSTMFCAGNLQGGTDSCAGDSGGPLVYNNSLVGIVSWGLGCARQGVPGVYTRLANPEIWEWIQDYIAFQ